MVCQTPRLDYEVGSGGIVQGRGRSSAPAAIGRGYCDDDGDGGESSLVSLCCYRLLHICHSPESD